MSISESQRLHNKQHKDEKELYNSPSDRVLERGESESYSGAFESHPR